MAAKIVLVALMAIAVSAQVSVINNPSQAQLDSNDILVLQYAETLENLEASFYNRFVPMFNASSFVAAGYDASIYAALLTIQAHENAHSAFLNATLGAYAIPPCTTYTWPTINTPTDLLKYALIFENVGVSAYDGAANLINNPTYIQVAATIATIEARHASFLTAAYYNNGTVIPQSAYDAANPPATVASIVAPYLTVCQYNPATVLPLPYVVVPVTTALTVNPSSYQLAQNDIAALNYALYLENLENMFYLYGLSVFSQASFSNAGYPVGTYQNFQLISAHETAHAQALAATVTSLGGMPTPNCTYNFAAVIGTNIALFVATAQALENTGVMAYDGALNTIYNPALKQVAATIATIEARHAAYLNRLNNNSTANANAFVSANNTGYPYDYAASYAEIVAKVASTNLIISCPMTPVAPTTVRLASLNNATSTQSGTSRAPTGFQATTTNSGATSTSRRATTSSTGVSTSTRGSTSTTSAPVATSGASSVVVSFAAMVAAISLLL